jgi:CRISPR-associated protein Cmr5
MPNTDTTTITGIEHGRATTAYTFAKSGEALGGGKKIVNTKIEDSKEAKEYKSYVKKIPMMIKSNGLGATLAFVKSKQKKEAYNLIYTQLSEWLTTNIITAPLLPKNTNFDLVNEVISKDSSEYRTIAIETLALFNWLRRFAEGLIQGESDEQED